MEITSAKIDPSSTDKVKRITWEGTGGFGEIDIKYLGNGIYHINSEYLDFDTIFKIIRRLDEYSDTGGKPPQVSTEAGKS